MIKAIFKKKSIKLYIIILLLIIPIGTICLFGCVPYYKEKRAVIRRIEAQIAEMEAEGIDEASYYIVYSGTISAYINSIEDKKFMIKLIKNSKDNWIVGGIFLWIIPGDKPVIGPKDIILTDVGDIRISHYKTSNYLRSQFIYRAQYKMSEEDLAAFREFVSGLEQREPAIQD